MFLVRLGPSVNSKVTSPVLEPCLSFSRRGRRVRKSRAVLSRDIRGVLVDDGPRIQVKKTHKAKLLGPDIFCWGGGLPREGVGAKEFGMSLATISFGGVSRELVGIS